MVLEAITHQLSLKRLTAKVVNFQLKAHNILQPFKTGLLARIIKITGFIPGNLLYYRIALTHKSTSPNFNNNSSLNNERLEYLGDAILNAVIADFLFYRFPNREEGSLTKMRSEIVNRGNLNRIATGIGINRIMFHKTESARVKNIYGNALEAFIGAVFVDKGYKRVKKFIVKRLINKYVDMKELQKNDSDYKSKVLRWVQKNNMEISFQNNQSESGINTTPLFTASVKISDLCIAQGDGETKKEAQQNACKQALKMIEV